MICTYRLLSVVFLAMAATACHSKQLPPGESGEVVQWALPAKLNEVSGLALTPDQRLLAVADEEAIVYEIDFRNGGLVKAFAVGDPTMRGDFEGIAVLNAKVWLMDSDGRLYSFNEGEDGERVVAERFKTGLGDECEFEGLASDRTAGRLLLICKESRKKKKGLRIFAWLASGDDDQDAIEIALDDDELGASIGRKEVNPSGLAIDPATGNLIVVAARQRAVLELAPDGMLIKAIMQLDARRHEQPEGIAITNDGRLLIADEAGSRAARLTIYPALRQEKAD